MQNCIKLFSTAAKLFVWRFRLRRLKAGTVTSLLTMGVQRVKSVSHYKYLGIALDIELPDDKEIQRQLRYQKLVLPDARTHWKMYFLLYIHVCIKLWCDFRKAYIHRLRVADNFGCWALSNLPWRASVSSHQVQCNKRPYYSDSQSFQAWVTLQKRNIFAAPIGEPTAICFDVRHFENIFSMIY